MSPATRLLPPCWCGIVHVPDVLCWVALELVAESASYVPALRAADGRRAA